MKEVLVFSIIALFIGLAFIPSFNAISISKTDDTTPPEVKLVWDIEEGIVRFTAICSDDTGIDYVIFTWNAMIVAGCYEEPYEWIVDLETVNKQHICAIASDFTGNSASDCVDFRSRKLDIKSTDDCDCQSNEATHLAEKLLNRLKKNEILSNEIDSIYPKEDSPLCDYILDQFWHYQKLMFNYLDESHKYENGSFWYRYYQFLYYMSIYIMAIYLGITILLDCDIGPYYP